MIRGLKCRIYFRIQHTFGRKKIAISTANQCHSRTTLYQRPARPLNFIRNHHRLEHLQPLTVLAITIKNLPLKTTSHGEQVWNSSSWLYLDRYTSYRYTNASGAHRPAHAQSPSRTQPDNYGKLAYDVYAQYEYWPLLATKEHPVSAGCFGLVSLYCCRDSLSAPHPQRPQEDRPQSFERRAPARAAAADADLLSGAEAIAPSVQPTGSCL